MREFTITTTFTVTDPDAVIKAARKYDNARLEEMLADTGSDLLSTAIELLVGWGLDEIPQDAMAWNWHQSIGSEEVPAPPTVQEYYSYIKNLALE